MKSSLLASLALLFCLLLSSYTGAASANTIITMENNCPYSIWPGVFSDRNSVAVENPAITLAPGASFPVAVPYLWKGRILATTVCSFKPSTVDSGENACNGAYDPNIPATHVQFSLGSSARNATDEYSISLADGYNLPVNVVPQGVDGRGSDCASLECVADINEKCPVDLRLTLPDVTATVGCLSACQTFGTDRDCCKGKFDNPGTCPPTQYTQFFKNSCPQASSYSRDKPISPPVCSTAATPSYKVTFCPAPSTVDEGRASSPTANPLQSRTQASPSPPVRPSPSQLLQTFHRLSSRSRRQKGFDVAASPRNSRRKSPLEATAGDEVISNRIFVDALSAASSTPLHH